MATEPFVGLRSLCRFHGPWALMIDSVLTADGLRSIRVDQTVHGYRRGHQLIAASVQLDADDAELVRRLSDLSGILTPETPFLPYLTAYPLPSNRYYVVAKTWLDEMAPRDGCVLTHSLLVPMKAWERLDPPVLVRDFFASPAIHELQWYESP